MIVVAAAADDADDAADDALARAENAKKRRQFPRNETHRKNTKTIRTNQIWDPDRVILIPDHYIFTSDPRANRNVDILRDMAKKYGIKHFYDITDR